MSNKLQHYQVIDEFFDAFGLHHARHLLSRIIKTADAQKVWKGPCPANVIYFTERMQLLSDAVFSIVEQYDYRKEVILDEAGNNKLWMLTAYDAYCGWHRSSTPWHFFPRHLSAKEFLDPYKALDKFTRHRSLHEWKEVLKEFSFHALSPNSISEFDDGTGILGTWLHLHKLLEATHLIEVRTKDDEKQPRKKWNGNQQDGKAEENNNQEEEALTLEELAWAHIKEFFLFFGEEGAREELWAMLKRSLSNEGDETPAKDRSNMVFVYEQLVELVDDIHVLHQHQQAKQNLVV